MKIFYVGAFRLPNLDAGAPRVINNAKALSMLGCQVTLISWGGTYRAEDLCEDGKYRVAGCEYIISNDLPQTKSLWERLKSKIFRGKESLKIIKQRTDTPDLLISYNADLFFTLRLILYCKKNNIKYANDINEWFSAAELNFIDVICNWINMSIVQTCVKNKILISSWLMNYYNKHNSICIPPLCDINDKKWSFEINNNLDYSNSRTTFIYAGSPYKKDALDMVVNVINGLLQEGEDICFLILGVSKQEYTINYGQIELNKNIKFLGRVNQDLIPSYYKLADFMILMREVNRKNSAGFPTKFAESFTAGIPVIANKTSDVDQYIVDGKTGFMISEFSEKELRYVLKNRVLCLTKQDIINIKSNVSRSTFDYNFYIPDFERFINNLI